MPLEHADCSLCGEAQRTIVDRKTIWAIAKCTNCGMMYLSPRLTREGIRQKVYNSEYSERLEVIHQIAGTRVASWRAARLKSLRFPATHLDVGCGLGALCTASRELGVNSVGIDINPKFSSEFVMCRDMVASGLPDDSFDLITINDIAEHVYDVHAFAAELARILKPDGLIVAEIPNCASEGFRTLGARWPNNPFPEHVQFWTPDMFARLWPRHGLASLRVEYECSLVRGEEKDAIFSCIVGAPGLRV